MRIRPNNNTEQEVVYAEGGFGENGAFVMGQPEGEIPFGRVLCCPGGDYSVEFASDGRNCSYFNRWPLTTPDGTGKAWYIRDVESGDVWSPFPFPTIQNVDEYQVSLLPGQVSAYSLRNKIACTLTVAAVPELSCEVWLVKLCNLSAKNRTLTFTTYAEPVTGQTFESRSFDNGKVMLLRQPLDIFETPVSDDADTDLVVFQASTLAPARRQIEKSLFIGEKGSFAKPQQVTREEVESCEDMAGQAVCSMTVEIELPIEGEAEFGFAFGAAPGADKAFEAACRFTTIKPVIDAVRKSSWQWKNLCSHMQVDTPDPTLNALVNTWLPYEAYAEWVAERNATSYVSPDSIGNDLRRVYPFTAANPDMVRRAIMEFASRLSVIGAYYVSEDLAVTVPPEEQLWLALCTATYVIETGDTGILGESVPLRDGPRLTVREHCERAVRMSIHSGSRQSELTEKVIELWSAVNGEDCEFGPYIRSTDARNDRADSGKPSARMRYLQQICPTLAGMRLPDTGSCELYSQITERLLGLTALPQGLALDPRLPRTWEQCEITRRFRGSSYRISVIRAEGLIQKRPSMLVDGEPVDGNMIPNRNDGANHAVRLVTSDAYSTCS